MIKAASSTQKANLVAFITTDLLYVYFIFCHTQIWKRRLKSWYEKGWDLIKLIIFTASLRTALGNMVIYLPECVCTVAKHTVSTNRVQLTISIVLKHQLCYLPSLCTTNINIKAKKWQKYLTIVRIFLISQTSIQGLGNLQGSVAHAMRISDLENSFIWPTASSTPSSPLLSSHTPLQPHWPDFCSVVWAASSAKIGLSRYPKGWSANS